MARTTDKASVDAVQNTLRQLDRADADNKRTIQKLATIDRGYPVGATFPTGVSDGFVFFNTNSRRLHMYDGTTWIALSDVGAYIEGMKYLSGLLTLWPMNFYDSAGQFYDITPRAKTLTNTGTGVAVLNSRVSYGTFNGTTSVLSRADEADFDITGSLTFGCWIKLGGTATQAILSKLGAVGQYAYEIGYSSAAGFYCHCSNNGTALKTATSSHPSPGTTSWYHIVGRFTPSTEVAIIVNGVKTTNVSSIPATIFNSTAAFNVGRRSDGTLFSTSSITLPFISTSAFSDDTVNALYEEGLSLFQ